jgi:hypothetical protein
MSISRNLKVLEISIAKDCMDPEMISVNNFTAILQLKSNNVIKGVFQLNGNDFQFDINSGNTTGDVIFRMDNAEVISIDKLTNIKLPYYFKNESCVKVG